MIDLFTSDWKPVSIFAFALVIVIFYVAPSGMFAAHQTVAITECADQFHLAMKAGNPALAMKSDSCIASRVAAKIAGADLK